MALAVKGLDLHHLPGLYHGWRTLDLLEHVEGTIHRVVRRPNAGATPPELECTRTSPTRVTIVYRSARQMCAVGKGIARGVAQHYGERIHIAENGCMTRGAPVCTITVELLN